MFSKLYKKIFACVLVMAMAASMLPVGAVDTITSSQSTSQVTTESTNNSKQISNDTNKTQSDNSTTGTNISTQKGGETSSNQIGTATDSSSDSASQDELNKKIAEILAKQAEKSQSETASTEQTSETKKDDTTQNVVKSDDTQKNGETSEVSNDRNVTDRFIVKFKDKTSGTDFKSNAATKLSSNVKEVKNTKNNKFYVLTTKDKMGKEDVKSMLKQNNADSNIEYIQPDYIMTSSSDPLLAQQWGNNSSAAQGGTNSSTATSVDANVTQAWSQSQGDGIIIAILDSGIDITHPDLAGNIFTNSREIANNGVDDDGNGYVDDVNGWDFFNKDNSVNDAQLSYDQWHGTHIEGIIAAQKDNGIGIAGVAPNAKILPIKIFEGGVAYTSDIIDAIEYAQSMGAKVINCSWGSRYENPALKEAIANSNALFVCATGNNLYNIDNYPVYPAAYSKTMNNVISVAAIDKSGLLCRFSNYGANSVDIAAPGEDILSTWINGEYRSISGTSMSAGFASGAAALVFSKNNSYSAYDVKQRLINSADTVTGLQDKIIGGKKLNCAYAVSNNSQSNTNILNISDSTALPVIVPDTVPSMDDYTQSGAENYVEYRRSMSTARHGLQLVTLNGKVYAIGGQTTDSGGYSSLVESYDPDSDSWTTVASLNQARSYFGAVVYNSKIYVMGGKNGTGSYLNSIEVYDPTLNTWTVSSRTMTTAMCAFSATLMTGTSKVYIVGGCNSAYYNSVYEYDIAANTYTAKTSLSVPIADHVAFYYNGKIYVEGGLTTNGNYTYSEYQYTISTGTTASAVMARSYLSDAAGIITNDRFISIGGINWNAYYSTDMTILHY